MHSFLFFTLYKFVFVADVPQPAVMATVMLM